MKDGIREEDRVLVLGFDWPNANIPVAFVQVYGEELLSGSSKYNPAEVEKISFTLQKIVQAGDVRGADIGIISLYAAQVKELSRAFQDDPLKSCEVNSVDGFQGKEKELILISCVRCNQIGRIGFLDDPRRFNVMLTRARRGVIVFGDRESLRTNEMWEKWLLWCEENNLCVG